MGDYIQAIYSLLLHMVGIGLYEVGRKWKVRYYAFILITGKEQSQGDREREPIRLSKLIKTRKHIEIDNTLCMQDSFENQHN